MNAAVLRMKSRRKAEAQFRAEARYREAVHAEAVSRSRISHLHIMYMEASRDDDPDAAEYAARHQSAIEEHERYRATTQEALSRVNEARRATTDAYEVAFCAKEDE